jgi:hypothetical protein
VRPPDSTEAPLVMPADLLRELLTEPALGREEQLANGQAQILR